MNDSTRGLLYMNIKSSLAIEPYLLKLPLYYRNFICKLRCSNVKFPVETGRWMGICREERTCNLCDDTSTADEFHYLFICKNENIRHLRQKYIPDYYTRHPNIHKMYGLFSFCNIPVMKRLAIFISKLIPLL